MSATRNGQAPTAAARRAHSGLRLAAGASCCGEEPPLPVGQAGRAAARGQVALACAEPVMWPQAAFRRATVLAGFYQHPIEVCQVVVGKLERRVGAPVVPGRRRRSGSRPRSQGSEARRR